jgi:hypothetical protein
MKKIVLVAVAATALAAPAQAASNAPTAASTYVVERPDSSAHSPRRATAIILRDRRPAEVAAVPRARP